MARGALGAVVIAYTQRLPNSFAAIDYFEGRGLSFAIAVNCFDGTAIYTIDSVYNALDLDRHFPIVLYDARPRILQDGATSTYSIRRCTGPRGDRFRRTGYAKGDHSQGELDHGQP